MTKFQKSIIVGLFLSLPFWLWVGLSFGATYYVQANGEGANKAAGTACGNVATTMSPAVFEGETFASGDTVILCNDVDFTGGTVDPPTSGEAGNYITYEMEAGGLITGGAGNGITITKSYVKLIGFNVTAAGLNGIKVIPDGADVQYVEITNATSYANEGAGYTGRGMSISVSYTQRDYAVHHVALTNYTAYDNYSAGLTVESSTWKGGGPHDILIDGFLFYNNVTSDIDSSGGSTWSASTDIAGADAAWTQCPTPGTCDNATTYTYDAPTELGVAEFGAHNVFAIGTTNATELMLTPNDTNYATLSVGEWDVKNDDGVLYVNFGGAPGVNIKVVSGRSQDVIWQNGISHSNNANSSGVDGNGLYVDVGSQGVRITKSKFYTNDGNGISMNYADDVTVDACIFYNNGVDETGADPQTEEIMLRKHSGHTTGVFLYNNTFYSSAAEAVGLRNFNGGAVTMKNNILSDSATYGLLVDETDEYVVTETNNLFYNNTSGNISGVNADTINGTSDAADPLFRNATGNDLSLLKTSPAIDAGADVGLTEDFRGTPTPQGGVFDIGAYEHTQLAGSFITADGGGNIAYDYVAPAAASLNTTDMTRGFEADSDPGSWAGETDTSGIYSRYNGTVYHSGSYSASVAGGYTTKAYQVYDMGATKAALSYCFWYYTPTTGGTDTIVLLAIGSSGGGSYGLKVYFQYAAGHYHFGLRGATGPTYGTVNITNGAWHRVEVDYAQAGTSTITIYDTSGTQVDTVSLTAVNYASRYLNFGKVDASVRTDWTTGYYDDVGLDFADATSPLWEYTVAN